MAPVSEQRGSRVVAGVAVGFLVAATLVWSSGEDMFFGLLLVIVLGGWGLVAVHGVASLVVAGHERAPQWFRRWAIGSIGGLVAFVGSLGIGAAGVPEDVRIRLSRDDLTNAGERVLAGEHPTRAGLYGLSETRVTDDRCALLETGNFAVSSFGFAYCPDGRRPGSEHLGGGLYKYSYD